MSGLGIDPRYQRMLPLIRENNDYLTDAHWDGKVKMMAWDTGSLSWVPFTGTGGGGGDATAANQTTEIARLTTIADKLKDKAVKMDDYTTVDIMYIGYGLPGADPTAAVWAIKKIDFTAGAEVTWADGNNSLDNIWNNRAALSYS